MAAISVSGPNILSSQGQLEKIQQEMSCSICLEHLCLPVQLSTSHTFNGGKKIKCTHKFCLICIRTYFGMNNQYRNYENYFCPKCRASAPRQNTYFHQESDHYILDILQNGTYRPCPNSCGFEWDSQSTIRNHLLKNCENGFSQCSICRTSMKRKDLILHELLCADKRVAPDINYERLKSIRDASLNPELAHARTVHLEQIIAAKTPTNN